MSEQHTKPCEVSPRKEKKKRLKLIESHNPPQLRLFLSLRLNMHHAF